MVKVKRPCPPNELRLLRAKHRLTQFDLAAHLGINRARYWQIENSYTAPTEAERKALCRLFKVAETDIFGVEAA
jgi:transcriptional regulator with XRE-family HTH domain